MTDKEILGWDVYNWSKALHYWRTVVSSEKSLNCLELGANKGGLTLWLASLGHHVVCNDIKPFPPEIIEEHRKSGFSQNISYEIFDAVEIPHTDKFDLIILKSVLGGVGRGNKDERIAAAIKQINKALKPGGLFLFAENLKATKLHSLFRKNFVHWAKDWNYMSKEQFINYMRIFSEVHVKTSGFMGAFGFNESSKSALGKIDTAFMNKLPQNWQYIIYGHAIK